MKIGMYSVFCMATGAFLQPFFAPNVVYARRMISDCFYDEDHMFSRHSADYKLHLLGEWDDSTGQVVPESKGPVYVCSVLELHSRHVSERVAQCEMELDGATKLQQEIDDV